MATFFDQLPSSRRGGGFFSQLPSQRGIDPIEEGLRQARSNAIHQASRAVQQGDTQFAKDILMPFGIAPAEAPRTARPTPPRVIGSAERGYSAFDPNTGEVTEILPGRGGALSDIDKARIRMIQQDRDRLMRTISELPETHPQRDSLIQQLQAVEASANELGITNAPLQQPVIPPPDYPFPSGEMVDPRDAPAAAPPEEGGGFLDWYSRAVTAPFRSSFSPLPSVGPLNTLRRFMPERQQPTNTVGRFRIIEE